MPYALGTPNGLGGKALERLWILEGCDLPLAKGNLVCLSGE